MKLARLSRLAAFIVVCTIAKVSHAYTIETPVTDGCHEKITKHAWRETLVALPDTTNAPRSSSEDEALIEDVPFAVPESLKDIGFVTLLIGVRYSDTKDHGAMDLGDIGVVHADPNAQKAHCLRAPNHDEPMGSELALDECRMFIREQLIAALDALGPDGKPDASRRERLTVSLAIRGRVEVQLPVFYLRAGQALHALQDSFTHLFRNPEDARKVRAVLNFVDLAEDRHKPSVDGPAHLAELDRCDDPDALREERRVLATAASSSALRALLDPAQNRDQKIAAIDATISEYLSFDDSQDCNAGNDWCHAPELSYAESACGCRAVGSAGEPLSWTIIALALAGFLVRRQPVRSGYWGTHSQVLGFCVAVGFSLAGRTADAKEPKLDSPIQAIEGRSKAGTPGRRDPAGSFFGRFGAGASYDNPALVSKLGLSYQFSEPWMLAFDVEWNPWIALSPGKIRPGAINTYFSAIRRFQLKSDRINVRTTASLGTSVMLFDLVGAPAGNVGPFIGISFLGAEWKASPGVYVTVDPTYIAIPIPQLTGTPFAYSQYRFQVGLEFGG